MNYTLHQLEVFTKVAETNSVSKASRLLFLSQPAVSIQLRKLQEQFAIPLFRNVGRNIEITEFGYEIASLAHSLLEKAQELKNKTLAYQGITVGQVKIVTASSGKYVMPYFLSGFVKKYPNVDLVMDVTNRERSLDSLMKQKVDFALISVMPDDVQVQSIGLLPQWLYLVNGRDKNLPNVRQKDWTGFPLIFREEGSGTRILMEKYLRDKGITYSVNLELTSNEAILQAVKAGLGISVIPMVSMQHELGAGEIQIVDAPGFPLKANWQLIYLKDRPMLPACRAFVDYLKEHKAGIVQEWFGWMDHG